MKENQMPTWGVYCGCIIGGTVGFVVKRYWTIFLAVSGMKILLTALHRFPVFVCFGNGLKLELKQHEDSRIRHASFNCYFCVVFPKRNAPRSGFGTISSSVIAKVYYSKIKSSLNIWNSR